MGRPRLIRCSLPTAVEVFLREDLEQAFYTDMNKWIVLFNEYGYKGLAYTDFDVDNEPGLSEITIPEKFMVLEASVRDKHLKDITTIQKYTNHYLRKLQTICKKAKYEVRISSFHSEISELILPDLKEIGERIMIYHEINQPLYEDIGIDWEGEIDLSTISIQDYAFHWEFGSFVNISDRRVYSLVIPYIYGKIMGVVYYEAFTWLNDLSEFRCLVCGSELRDVADRNTRRFCTTKCKRAFNNPK
jgi:hypothetical protein